MKQVAAAAITAALMITATWSALSAPKIPAGKGAAAVIPVRLTSLGDNVKPFVAVRPSGGAYIAWAQKNGQKSAVLFARARDGAHLDSPVQVSMIGMHLDLGAESGPNVTVDGKGNIYVVWTAGSNAAPPTARAAGQKSGTGSHVAGAPPRPGNLNIWLARSDDDGATFSLPARVNDDVDGPEHRFPTVAVDSHGGICVAWLDKRTKSAAGEDVARVFFARSTDGGQTFGPNVDATSGQPNPICHCCRVGVACDAGQGLLIAFRNDIDDLRDMFLIRTADAGRSFSAPAPLEHTGWKLPNCPMDGPSIAVDTSGSVHAAWMSGANIPGIPAASKIQPDDSKVLYTTTAPGSTAARPPVVLGAGHHPRLALSRAGDTFITWHDRSICLARIAKGGQEPAQILKLAGDKGAPSYPSIAAEPGGGVYCAWQQLMPDDSVQIYLAHVPLAAFTQKP